MRLNSLTTRLIVWVLGATLAVSVITFYVGFVDNRRQLEEDATATAVSTAVALTNDVAAMIRGIEQATRTLGSVVEHVRPDPDQSRALLRSLIEADEAIFGAAVAYAPEAFIAGTDFAAYVHRTDDKLRYLDIASQDPGFRDQPWYANAARDNRASWSEPYLDVDLGGVDMVTYSIPVFQDTETGKRLLAVVTADVSLDTLRTRTKAKSRDIERDLRRGWPDEVPASGGDKPFRIVLLSAAGRVISSELPVGLIPRDASGIHDLPLQEFAAERGFEDLRVMAERMRQGETDTTKLVGLDRVTRYWAHFRPLALTGWSVAVLVDETRLLVPIQEREFIEKLTFALYLVVIAVVVVAAARRITSPLRVLATTARDIGHDPLAAKVPELVTRDEVGDLAEALRRMQVDLGDYVEQLKATLEAKQRLEGELAAAHQIQMAMLPRLPDHGRLVDGCDVAATLIPAKAVGGDLFDLVPLPDGRLMFLVGDVSDKGAAAALFMAKTVTLANLLGRERVAPGALLARLNRELCHDNEACMFVTAVCGVLDPESGEVLYANAGHNPPLLCRPENNAHYLEMPTGTALGVFDDAEYPEARHALQAGEILLLYTDGVTEAINHAEELFGEARLEALPIGLFDTSRAMVEGVVRAVEEFAEGVEQADDITVLALRRTDALPLSVETRMAGGVAAIATVQAWLTTHLRRAGVDADLVGDIDLVADEVLANIVHHAHRDRSDAEVLIRLEVDDARVVVRFSDAGPAYDPLVEAPEPDLDQPAEEREIGGLGIHLVKSLADRVGYSREAGRNVLEVEKIRAGR